MPTIIVFVRILICSVLLCAPLLFYVIGSRKSENALWFLFPMFGGVPAILGALFIFVPLEGFLDAQALGHWKNAAVPLAGSLLIFAVVLLRCVVSGHFLSRLQRIFTGEPMWPFLLWSILGAIWGALWRLSDWIVSFVRGSMHALSGTLGT